MSQSGQDNATVADPLAHVATLVAKAEALCHAVAGRDLGATPLYIVPQSSVPPDCGSGDRCYAVTTPSLDIYLAQHIPNYLTDPFGFTTRLGLEPNTNQCASRFEALMSGHRPGNRPGRAKRILHQPPAGNIGR